MSKRIKRTDYSTKIRTVQDIAAGKTSINQAARDLALSPSTVQGWVNKFRTGTLQERSTKKEKDLEKENQKLKQTIGGLYVLIEELKKTADLKRRRRNANSSVITEENLDQFLKPVK